VAEIGTHWLVTVTNERIGKPFWTALLERPPYV
jgi:hypothetical protein